MNRFAILLGLVTTGVFSTMALPRMSYAQTTYTGTVERVWEDGFRLNTGESTLRVDAWELYGDNTPQHIAVGDSITVTGEFDRGEFDAFSVADAAPSSP